ncbi:hypothetical protein QZH41_013793, partial [Actinostola sp. cb2023]
GSRHYSYHYRLFLDLVPVSYRPSGIQCMLELRFLAAGFEGIVKLQDALQIKGMLNEMPVQSFFISSSDVPGKAPRIAKVTNASSTSIHVSWYPIPRRYHHGRLLGYRVFYKDIAITNDSHYDRITVGPDIFEIEVTALRKHSSYVVQIAGFNGEGEGIPSKAAVLSTDEDVPSQPPTFLSLYNTSSSSLRVTWQAIPPRYIHGILLGYRVLYRSLNVTNEKYVFKEVGGPSSLEVILSGLFKYMDYGIRVLGFTKIGLGTVSDEVIVKTDQDVPSWPPEEFEATNKSSPTKIHVSWQPISDPYYIHGILLGFKVIYRALRNPDQILNGRQEVLVLGPNVYSVTIVNLTSYTMYSVEVLAFTIKGDGVSSKTLYVGDGVSSKTFYVETCNCHRTMYSNWWSNPPYTKQNVTGIFPTMLEMLTTKCCGACAEHPRTEIDFTNSSSQSAALKSNENQVRRDIEEVTEMHFPITGRDGQMVYNDFAFVPLVESGGTVFMTMVDEPGKKARMVVASVFSLWPMCMAVFVSAFFAGILMWLMDTFFNTEEFPRSPFRGIMEGMWWAFITMTTLGYGDRVPKAVHSKSFAIVWITGGLVIVALFMSFITTSLTTEIMSSETMIYGSKVAALQNSSEFRLGIRLNGIMDQDVVYEDLIDVYKALKRRNVDGVLIDAYSVGSRNDLFGDPEFRITKIISHSSSYGVVLAGKAKTLQICYRTFLKEERALVFAAITSNIHPLK